MIFLADEFSHQDWRENPYRLVSLMELFRLRAEAFCRLTEVIGKLTFQLASGSEAEDLKSIIETYLTTLGVVEEQAKKLKLRVTVRQIERIAKNLDSPFPEKPEVRNSQLKSQLE